jgi:hypothetical protein
MEGRNGRIQKILEEYEQADRKRRINLWLMFFELRDELDEIESHDKYPPRKFGVDPCGVCCRE